MSISDGRWQRPGKADGYTAPVNGSRSTSIFLAAIALYAVLSAFYAVSPGLNGLPASGQPLPAPLPVIALASFAGVMLIYGGLGYLGMLLSRRIGFADVWDPRVSNLSRFGRPALGGALLGVLFIVIDRLLSPLSAFGPLPHPPFPGSLIASLSASIGEETIFRLFFISFWVWLIRKLTRQRGQKVIVWIVAVYSGLVFAASHLPSLMVLTGTANLAALPPPVLAEVFVLNGALSLAAAFVFWRYGILAAMGLHFWTDVVWHVVYGLAQGG